MDYKTIYDLACEHPSKPAVTYSGTTISYAAFANAIGATYDYLNTQELPQGHNIVVRIHNLLDCWVAVLALQAHGLNTVCVASTKIIDTLAIKSVAGVVITELESPKLQLEPDARTGNRLVRIPNPKYRDEEISPYTSSKSVKKTGDHILYTSGTTGTYKKLLCAADLEQRRAAQRVEYAGQSDYESIYCGSFGLWTAVGYKIPASTWQAHGCVIFDQRPDWCRHFLDCGMTEAILIPDEVTRLLNVLEEQPCTSPPLDFRLHVTAGFLSRKLAEQLINRVTKDLVIAYGATETNIAVLQTTVTDLDDLHWLEPTDYHTVEIVDEKGDTCAVDQEGELRIQLNELDYRFYLDNQETTERVFRSGYFYPGDMAVRRADNRIRILGRSADVVNIRGQKLSVAPIEERILNALSVSAVCLFSGVNSAGENEVVIAIEAERWPEKSELNSVGLKFAKFDQIRFAKAFPFPRTQTGTSKIDRVALRKQIFQVEGKKETGSSF